ncbi:MAG: DNA (cytosine-5-)-methyltransferase [Bacteroidota bacterium]
MASIWKSYEVVDLFCGVGGLTHGFQKKGFNVIAGFDLDASCKFAYEKNNDSVFIAKDVKKVKPEELLVLYKDRKKKVLVGCAPCQPFSSLTNKQSIEKKKWDLLLSFSDLITAVQPEVISMENVPRLLRFNNGEVFDNFKVSLLEMGYFIDYQIVDCRDYGIPQRRKRLVLLGSKLGPIKLIQPTHTPENYVTVADTIKDLPPINDGESAPADPLHKAKKLSDLNKKRIISTPEGGGWKDWDESLKLDCHKKETGKSYGSVYGRMKWNEPAPTMTTHCTGLGNGRFGHPEQDRAISLREAALFQTFPHDYDFIPPNIGLITTKVSRQIGNAVPVKLGEVIAESIKEHLLDLHGDKKV